MNSTPTSHTAQPGELNFVAAYDGQPLARVQALMREHAGALGLTETNSSIFKDIAALPGRYAPPQGRLVLAALGDEPAGCGGLVQIKPTDCEMKRIYVRPQFRGMGIGRALCESLIAEARAAGYARVLLDTKEEWTASIALYRSLGFVEIAPFREVKMPDLVWMGKELV